MTQQRSSYNSNSNKSSNSSAAAGNRNTTPTHSMYTLVYDEAAGKKVKEYVDGAFVYEEDGKFGPYIHIVNKGQIPTGDIYITKKKAFQ